MPSISRIRLASLWLLGLTLVSCGSRNIGDSVSLDDPTTGSGGGAGSGMTVAGTGAQGGAPGTGGVGGSDASGGVGGVGATGGSDGSGGSGGTGGTTPVVCPCTRRPGGEASALCLVGDGVASLGTIGPSGGGLGLNSTFSMEIPPMALTSETTLIASVSQIPPPIEFVDFSTIVVVSPFISTRLPVKISMEFSNKPGVPRTNLALYAAKDQYGPFTRVADSALFTPGLVPGSVRGTVTQFGAFFVGYPKTADQMDCP